MFISWKFGSNMDWQAHLSDGMTKKRSTVMTFVYGNGETCTQPDFAYITPRTLVKMVSCRVILNWFIFPYSTSGVLVEAMTFWISLSGTSIRVVSKCSWQLGLFVKGYEQLVSDEELKNVSRLVSIEAGRWRRESFGVTKVNNVDQLPPNP